MRHFEALLLVLTLSALGCARRVETTPASMEPSVGMAPSAEAGARTMSFFDLITSRHSVREFRAEPVSDRTIERVVDAANRAPSAGDLQAYEVVVVRSASRRRLLARAAFEQRFVADAPVVLVFLTHPARNAERYGERGARLYSLQDATIAAAHAQLAVHALGLGSVWVGAFDDAAVLEAVEAPAGLGASSLLVVGYPARAGEPTPRRSLRDLAHPETLGRSR
jgi:nitroreductase